MHQCDKIHQQTHFAWCMNWFICPAKYSIQHVSILNFERNVIICDQLSNAADIAPMTMTHSWSRFFIFIHSHSHIHISWSMCYVDVWSRLIAPTLIFTIMYWATETAAVIHAIPNISIPGPNYTTYHIHIPMSYGLNLQRAQFVT